MWPCRQRRIAARLWRFSRSSVIVRHTSRRVKRPRSWEASSTAAFHPTNIPTYSSTMVFSRSFSVSLPEEGVEAIQIKLEESMAADTRLPGHHDLMSLVEEILTFQDEIGNSKVRHRWTREYGFLKHQLGIVGYKSNDEDGNGAGNHNDDYSLPMELSAVEGSADEEKHQLVDLPYFDGPSLNRMDEQLVSIENRFTLAESISPESSSSLVIDGDLSGPVTMPSEMNRLGNNLVNDRDEKEPNNENDMVTGNGPSSSSNLAEKEEEDAHHEMSPKDSFARAFALLRSMREAEWSAYDLIDEEKSDDDADSDDEGEQDGEDHDRIVPNEDSFESYVDKDVDYDSIGITEEDWQLQDPEFTDQVAPKAVTKTSLVKSTNNRKDGILSTDESNELLVRLALSSDLEAEEILRRLMEQYQRMERLENLGFEVSAPNQFTHEILLLTLYRRLGAIGTAVQLIKQMIENEERWAPDTLLVATQILERRRNLMLSMEVLTRSFQDATRENTISSQVFLSTLRLAKQDDANDAALAILQMCMKETAHRHDRKVDKIIVDAINWPTRNRQGQKMDTTNFLKDLADLVEKRRMYIPGPIVWRHLVFAASEGALENEERCELVRRGFQKLLGIGGNWLTRNLFHQGIVVGEALGDTKLVADVATRFLRQEARLSSRISEDKIMQSLPVKDIIRAMEVCIRQGDNPKARSILDSCTPLLESGRIPEQIVESIYLLCLKGYAAKGEPASGLDLLNEMKLKSLHVSEEAYGTVIHAFAIAGNHAEAKDFFTAMETNGAMVPGVTCYDGLILSCVRSRSWQEALIVFSEAKERKLALHASTSHAVIMSASRHHDGGSTTTLSQSVKSIIQDIIETNSEVNKETCVLALQVLIPELGIKPGTTTLEDIRHRLRNMVGAASLSQERALELISCLRMAEIEDERCRLKKDISPSALPHRAWATALASIAK